MQRYFHPLYDRFGITNGLKNLYYDSYGYTSDPNTMEQAVFLNNGQPHGLQDTMVDSSWVVDGSYLRLNMAQLGYTFSNSLCKSLGISSLRVYATGDNLLLLCSPKFLGYDPEGTSETNKFGQNMVFYSYPRARTFTLGLNVTF
jgi:hypothetical protein